MKLTSKSQITLPKHIREVLAVGPGDEVDFIEQADGSVRLFVRDRLRQRSPVSLKEWADSVEGTYRSAEIDGVVLDGKGYIDWLRGPRDDIDAG